MPRCGATAHEPAPTDARVGGKPGSCLEDGVSTIRGLCACATHLLLVVGQRLALAGGWTGTSAECLRPCADAQPSGTKCRPASATRDAQKATLSFDA